MCMGDRLQAPRSGVVPAFLAEHAASDVAGWPAAAPERNPAAGGPGHVPERRNGATPETTADRRARPRRRPDVVLGFLRQAGLRVQRLTEDSVSPCWIRVGRGFSKSSTFFRSIVNFILSLK